ENPCNIDKLFRRIKQFGGHGRQGGGVSGLEVALWDIAGKAYNIPVYQMLGGKFRDKIRMYCDTDVEGKDTGTAMGKALRKRMEQGFTFLKMDLGIGQIAHEPGTISGPPGFLEETIEATARWRARFDRPGSKEEQREVRRRYYEVANVAHPFTGLHVTEKGL